MSSGWNTSIEFYCPSQSWTCNDVYNCGWIYVISGPLAALNIIANIMFANGQPNKQPQVSTVCVTQIAIPFVSTNDTLHLYIFWAFFLRNETKCFYGETRTKNTIPKSLQNVEIVKFADLHGEVQRASDSIKYEVYFKLFIG